MDEWTPRQIVKKAEHWEVWELLMRKGICERHCSIPTVQSAIEIAQSRDQIDVVRRLKALLALKRRKKNDPEDIPNSILYDS
jgi:hypothetical protein